MRSTGSELVHDGWVSFSDILLTLVCGILFVGMVSWTVAQDSDKQARSALTRLEKLENEARALQAEVEVVLAGIERARLLASETVSDSVHRPRNGATQ